MGRWRTASRWSHGLLRWLLVGVLLPGAFLTAACDEDPEPTLIDDSNAVREWAYHPAPAADLLLSPQQFESMEAAGALAVPAPSDWDIRVVWGALRCNTAPTIRVSGTDTAIESIVIDYGVTVPPGTGCGDELLIHAVDLRIAAGSGTNVAVSGRGG